jgi:hypothetical protein
MILESDFELQVASTRIFPGLADAVRNFAIPQVPPRPKDVVDGIRQYVQLAMNAVDIWILHTATNAANQDRREAILHEGEKTMLGHGATCYTILSLALLTKSKTYWPSRVS